MIDWREHIDEGSDGTERGALVKGTSVEVAEVLHSLAEGWTLDQLGEKYPSVGEAGLRACVEFAAELVQRQAMRPLIRQRLAGMDAHAERLVPHKDAMADLRRRSGEPEDET